MLSRREEPRWQVEILTAYCEIGLHAPRDADFEPMSTPELAAAEQQHEAMMEADGPFDLFSQEMPLKQEIFQAFLDEHGKSGGGITAPAEAIKRDN